MRIVSLICVLYVIVFASFAQKATNLRIDPMYAKGAVASEIFDEVNFIPLETSSKSRFNAIDQLEVTSRHFIILDTETNAVLIFNKNGSFHTKITGDALGYKGERIIPIFWLNRQDNLLYFISPIERNKMIKVDFDGKILSKDVTSPGSFSDLFFFPKQIIASTSYNVDDRYSFTPANEVSFIKDNIILKSAFPYNMKKEPLISRDIMGNGHSSIYYQGNDSTALFLRPYDYNIYKITSKEVSSYLNIILPAQIALPINFRSDTLLRGKRLSYINNNQKVVYNLSHSYQLGTNLFFKLNSSGYDTSYSLVYNFKSGNLINIENISPDKGSTFLAITDSSLGGTNFFNENFLNTDGQYLYTFYSALKLFEQKDLTTAKNPNYSKVIVDYFKTGSKYDNPILIQLKPKNNL